MVVRSVSRVIAKGIIAMKYVSRTLCAAVIFAFAASGFGSAHAATIVTSSTATGINSILVFGQNLEDELNASILNPLGITLEFGATQSLGFFTRFEGPGLTGLGGGGFILRFDTNVTDVRIRMGGTNGNRALFAYDFQIQYERDASQISTHPLGLVTLNPSSVDAIDGDAGALPAATGFLDLFVSDNVTGFRQSILTRKISFGVSKKLRCLEACPRSPSRQLYRSSYPV